MSETYFVLGLLIPFRIKLSKLIKNGI
jgi:hypothetical protein